MTEDLLSNTISLDELTSGKCSRLPKHTTKIVLRDENRHDYGELQIEDIIEREGQHIIILFTT